jgi:hypothetical protein
MILSSNVRLKLRFYRDWLREKVGRPWSDLRGISNSYAAKSTILIPLVGYWIIFNESIFPWLQLAQQIGGHLPSDHTRVRWFYMGLCAIAGGTFLYALRCPPEIKKYGDYRDYVNGDGPALTMASLQDIVEDLEKSGYNELSGAGKNDLMAVHYYDLNKSREMSRVVVTLLFAAGFLILTWLSLRVFAMVLWTWSSTLASPNP